MKFAIFIPMDRVVIGCLGVATALAAACGEGGGLPTRPSATATPSSLAATAPGSVRTISRPFVSAAAAEKDRPFTGSFTTGVGTDAFEPPSTLLVQFTATGNATHLGRFTAMFDIRIDVSNEATQTSTGTLTLIAADGDRVFSTLTGRATVVDGIASIVETVTITGGTGRFAEATGSFTIERSSDLVTGAAPPASFDGTISY